MAIIDVQVHAYERNHSGRPWLGHLHGPPSATGEEMVAAMDTVGVDGAIFVSSMNLYGYDASYAQAVRAQYPGRFALVKPVDTADPAVADTIAAWAQQDGAVGVRVLLRDATPSDPADPGINRVLAAAGKHGLVVNLLCWGRLGQVPGLAERNRDTVLVVDHLGLQQPFEPPAPAEPWQELPEMLALAKQPNLRIKVSGACTLSHEKYPFNDIWDPLARVFDAWGLDRCMWGTDWTRATALLTFREGVDAFRLTDRLSASDKAALMGGTCERVYGFTPHRS